METYQTTILIYILFIWCVVLHTLEEISQGVFDARLGPIKASKNNYLVGPPSLQLSIPALWP